MHVEFDPNQLPPNLRKVLSAEAPGPLRQMAARGILPGAQPAELLTVVAILSTSEERELASIAEQALAKLPQPLLESAFGTQLAEAVLAVLAERFTKNHWVVERLLRQPAIPEEALAVLAATADERQGELIATNEELMLRHPVVIEKLYLNKHVRMSTAERLLELAVRNGLELSIAAYREMAAAIKNELVCEPTGERTADDELFIETKSLAEQIEIDEAEDTHEVDEEGEEKLRSRFVPLHTKIAQMTVSQRIRCATLGNSAERLLLIRDNNRLVASAAAKSPQFKENEAICVTASRSISDEVLRIIAMNREFVRSYQIKYNLVTNPRTPFTFVARLIPHLREGDLKNLAKSKGVSGTVAQAIAQQLSRKSQTKR